MLDMSEIRKRSTLSSSSSGSYSRVSTEEDDLTDTVPTLNIHRGLKTTPTQKSVVCPKICFVFSLSGVLFLSVIAILLGRNTLYIKVSHENFHRKPVLAEGVTGAVFMWLACCLLSGYLWYRAANEKEYIEEDARLLE